VQASDSPVYTTAAIDRADLNRFIANNYPNAYERSGLEAGDTQSDSGSVQSLYDNYDPVSPRSRHPSASHTPFHRALSHGASGSGTAGSEQAAA
jgi:hypothetical protein